MINNIITKLFGVRKNELFTALLMQGYIFLIIAVLLIIKPTVNALFITSLGADNLPLGYVLIAVFAVITSFFYAKATERFLLKNIIQITLVFSILALITLGFLLHFEYVQGWILYSFYIGVAIYAVLATSQFWILANLVFNIREAKRLFGFIGAGAITGGIFGGYLTTFLAPLIGNENLIFLAATMLLFCFPLLSILWKRRIEKLNIYKQRKRLPLGSTHPFTLIRKSKHLTYLAIIIGVGVVTAKLVDYQFSDIAAKNIQEPEELASFFGFWFSTFNVISLGIQLFLTQRIVGIWGVGYSLLILPILLGIGVVLFFIFPELWVVILLKATDGSLKQSVNKASVELIALPLPFSLKKKTKSFIDVVIDSVATGIAGLLLIFLIKGLDVHMYVVTSLIGCLAIIWVYFVVRVRKEYFISFRKNLENLNTKKERKKLKAARISFLQGMINVFTSGNEKEILFMLSKAREVNDSRLLPYIQNLIYHPSNEVKVEVLKNLFFLNEESILLEIQNILKIEDDQVVEAALEYLLQHAECNESIVFDQYLNHTSDRIANAALVCLAKESRDNHTLQQQYNFEERILKKIDFLQDSSEEHAVHKLLELLTIIGYNDFKKGYIFIEQGLKNKANRVIRSKSIEAAGRTVNPQFIIPLINLINDKEHRSSSIRALHNYGIGIISTIENTIMENNLTDTQRSHIARVIASFDNQIAVDSLFYIFSNAASLPVRLEAVRLLTELKEKQPNLVFDRYKLARMILAECKLYDQTLNTMHTQIIVQYIRRKRQKQFNPKEIDARNSLMDILERRLESGLQRIFNLLQLRYNQRDIKMAYQGVLSDEEDKRVNAIEFLDIILNKDLKKILIPIVEATILDTSSDEVIEMLSNTQTTEYACFEAILSGNDLRLKLAVLYLILQKEDQKYLPLIESLVHHNDKRIRDLANKSLDMLTQVTSF